MVTKKSLAASGAALALAGTLLAGSSGSAGAAPRGEVTAAVTCGDLAYLSDPAVATGQTTVKQASGETGTAQIRSGWYNGRQYGWAKASSSAWSSLNIVFEVDVNGDRKADCRYSSPVSSRIYTAAKATHSSSAVAFRACILFSVSNGCDAAATKTGWW
ncbi:MULTISPECIES: hypothetical protein [Streptomyces]|uniref:Secreted protein n=1 Tax=Streptomyces solicathayae TaxID=3081768 RepID=A0ABZ0LYE5_9ACTN|nr:hypothetical protein [Streptomyces sp. HUAS YS2]WOX24468.1 hypothetical protein R2D22_25035 [Streptomyces sp. HUAS YS2]